MTKLGKLNLLLGLFCLAPLLVSAKAPQLVDLKVFPSEVRLRTAGDRQSVVVQAVYSDGVTRDVTAQAGISLGNKALVKLQNAALHPLADGQTDMTVKFERRTVKVPVQVEQAKVERPVSFTLDVVPVMSKAGCNTGSCHGSSRGKDGFKLSLFGYDPDGDFNRLTLESIARRVNLALPEESLLLEKGAGQVPHTGGEKFKRGSESYRTVLRWIQDGAPKDSTNLPQVVRVEMEPKQSVLEGSGSAQRLTVRAFYSDGTDRDVTPLAVFMSNNDVAVKVSDAGVITSGARGEAFITARFEAHTVGAQALSIPKGLKFTFPDVPEVNYVDTLVNAKLKKLRIAPSELCDDHTFVRRVYLDVIGRLPTAKEVRKFIAESGADKRAALIDALVNKKEFADIWVMKLAELLQVRSQDQIVRFSYKSAYQYFDWLDEQVSKNVPVNQIAYKLLTANGGSFKNPAANFYKVETDTLKTAENVAQVFMGMRIQCAQCHNHPFDRWTMNDYYSFAAFFSQVGRKTGEDPRETVVFNRASGGVRHPVGGRDMAPKFLGDIAPSLKADDDRRDVLAKWLTSTENKFFARNFANLVWAHFFGRGIIDPVDDVRVSNPPSNPELLDTLAAKLVENGYGLKNFVRDLCNSRTYQLSAKSNDTNAGDELNFAKAGIRRIRAEVLMDAIDSVTGTEEKYNGLPKGARAVQIADGRTTTYFLTTFGRATRETPCSCEVKMEPNLSQALHLLNGSTVNGKVIAGGVVKSLLKEGKTPPQVVDDLYLRVFARPPTAPELAKIEKFLADAKDKEVVLNDLFWSLLNAKEFVFNH
ncbi:MAG: DUF1553 domain-containing protein [Verrucomicrobia bacterium]|nr:DUF1553 domain-containing protein [Verrucomicrobiota bacterium]